MRTFTKVFLVVGKGTLRGDGAYRTVRGRTIIRADHVGRHPVVDDNRRQREDRLKRCWHSRCAANTQPGAAITSPRIRSRDSSTCSTTVAGIRLLWCPPPRGECARPRGRRPRVSCRSLWTLRKCNSYCNSNSSINSSTIIIIITSSKRPRRPRPASGGRFILRHRPPWDIIIIITIIITRRRRRHPRRQVIYTDIKR